MSRIPCGLTIPSPIQNKKRKFDRDRDERESKDRREEEPADPLKDATTLYVGNLYAVPGVCSTFAISSEDDHRSFYTTEEQIHELFAK